MPFEAGSLIADKVRLVRLLGAGGMGHVWVADHLTLDTRVAVKLISTEHAANPDVVARFRREAAAAAQMKCPHAVQILDFGIFDDRPFIVMELLEGEDLAQRIQRAGHLPVAFVGDVVTQVCKALSRAHALGIVHRDIKPENVFICEDQGDRLIKVLDFGIAKRKGDADLSMTSTGAALGSPYYMSPEQVVSAKAVDARSDLWSLGVVAYQAMTGKLPFVGETVGALAIAINDGKYPAPSSVRSGIPAAVDAWFERVLVKDLDARFRNAKEMAEAFARVTGRGPQRDEFGEAETDVAPCPDAKPSCADDCPTVRTSTPLVELRAPHSIPDDVVDTEPIRASQPDQALLPALAGTHMSATVSGTRSRSRSPVLWGVASGAVLFSMLAAIVGAIALGSMRSKAAAGAATEWQPEPSATQASVAPQPSSAPIPAAPEVAPVTVPAETAALPTASATEAPAPKPASKLPVPVYTPPRKKKDRGF